MASVAEQQNETAQRIHDLACALDDELDATDYTQRDENGHVDLFDGSLDTPVMATNMIENLANRGWTLSRTES